MKYPTDRSCRMKMNENTKKCDALSKNRWIHIHSWTWLILLLTCELVMGMSASGARNYKLVIDFRLPKSVQPAYLAYGGSKLADRREFHMRHPDGRDYVGTIKEELRAYQAAITIWDELKAKSQDLSDKRLDYISAVHSAGYLEAFVLDEYKTDFPEDYKLWLGSNAVGLERYRLWKVRQGVSSADARLDRSVSIVVND